MRNGNGRTRLLPTDPGFPVALYARELPPFWAELYPYGGSSRTKHGQSDEGTPVGNPLFPGQGKRDIITGHR